MKRLKSRSEGENRKRLKSPLLRREEGVLMVMKEDLAESCDSCSSMESYNSRKQVQQSGHKLEVFNEILRCLRESHVAETFYLSFEDELWAHFKRGTSRFVIDVNVERAEDVLMHKKLLEQARDPDKIPPFLCRLFR